MKRIKKLIRGRFRLSEKEKALRKTKRESEKRKKQLFKAKNAALKKNKTKDLVESTKKVAENPDQLSFAEGIKQAIQPVKSVQYLTDDSSNISLNQIAEFGQEQAHDLTERINLLEIEIGGIQKSLNQLNRAANGWQTERTMIKQLIKIDQDQIFEDEYKLDLMDARGQESPPDRPEILRHLISWVTNRSDEILVNMNLGRSESKLLARTNHLAKVDIELGSILITIRYQEDLLNNITSSNEFLRNIRSEIGELNRMLRRASKKEVIESTRKIYFKEFWNQMNKVNTIRDNLQTKMLEVNQGLNNLDLKFDQMQKESLRPIDKPSEAYKVTTALEKFILDLSKDTK